MPTLTLWCRNSFTIIRIPYPISGKGRYNLGPVILPEQCQILLNGPYQATQVHLDTSQVEHGSGIEEDTTLALELRLNHSLRVIQVDNLISFALPCHCLTNPARIWPYVTDFASSKHSTLIPHYLYLPVSARSTRIANGLPRSGHQNYRGLTIQRYLY